MRSMRNRRTVVTRSTTVDWLYAVSMGARKKICDRYAIKHPFYEGCQKRILRLVEKVHHKLPLAEGWTHDEENLASLCYARIHAEPGDGRIKNESFLKKQMNEVTNI